MPALLAHRLGGLRLGLGLEPVAHHLQDHRPARRLALFLDVVKAVRPARTTHHPVVQLAGLAQKRLTALVLFRLGHRPLLS